MDCSHCTLPKRVRGTQSRTGPTSTTSSSSDNDAMSTPQEALRQVSQRNTHGQLSMVRLPERDPITTVRFQLLLAVHNTKRNLRPLEVLTARRHLIRYSSHDLPPCLSCFAGLGSRPCNLYRVVSFDKLHVSDLGIIRQFCDLSNTVLAKTSQLPLSRTMSIVNLRFSTLPPSCRLSSHRPFRMSQHESQAGITGKIRRLSLPFIWVCLMGIPAGPPDEDRLLQCALQLDFV